MTARETITPEWVMANALQVMRIPGTRDHLADKFENQILRTFVDNLVLALAMYDYEIVSKKQQSPQK